jgi:hypothetical protein
MVIDFKRVKDLIISGGDVRFLQRLLRRILRFEQINAGSELDCNNSCPTCDANLNIAKDLALEIERLQHEVEQLRDVLEIHGLLSEVNKTTGREMEAWEDYKKEMYRRAKEWSDYMSDSSPN